MTNLPTKNNLLLQSPRSKQQSKFKSQSDVLTLELTPCTWADYLPMNVVRELMGHSSIATTAEFYNQVDADHEAKAARVIQRLIDKAESSEGSDKTDAKLTPEQISRQNGGDK
jgi:hypothetical protein